jgi:hypothetical protein
MAAVRDLQHDERIPRVSQGEPFVPACRHQPSPQHENRQQIATHEGQFHRPRRVFQRDHQAKEQLRGRLVGRTVPGARHIARLVGVRPLQLGIGGKHEVRVDPEALDAAVPQVADHVVVGTDRGDGDRRTHQDRKRQGAQEQSPPCVTHMPGAIQRDQVGRAGDACQRKKQRGAKRGLTDGERQHRRDANDAGQCDGDAEGAHEALLV